MSNTTSIIKPATGEYTSLETPANYIPTIARSIINPVKAMMPLGWTINPYRGCRHACVYCFARPTHTYYNLNAGDDFHSQIFVKVNAAKLLRKEISRASWKGEAICIGSVTDPYQPAERRYRLTRQILEILCEVANPVEIITKSPLILDDLELLVELNQRTGGKVGVNISLTTLDEEKARLIDPGVPSPHKRLETAARLSAAGIRTRLFIMPVLPGITDNPAELEEVVRAAAQAKVGGVVADALRIARGLEDYYMGFVEQHSPHLKPRYERIYGNRSFADKRYREALKAKMHELREKYGFSRIEGQAYEEPSRLEEALEEAENAALPFADPQRRTRPIIPHRREKQAAFDFAESLKP